MNNEKEFFKNTIILSIGNFLPKVVTIVTLPIITGILTKSEYGTLDLIATLIMLVIPIATLQAQSAAFRFLIECRGDKDRSSIIISNIYAITIIPSVIVATILGLVFIHLSCTLRIIIAFYFLMNSLVLTTTQIVRGLGYNKLYSINAIMMSIVNGIGIIYSLGFKSMGLVGYEGAALVSNICSLIFLAFKLHIFQYIKIRFISSQEIKRIISYSWPMIPNNLSTWVLNVSDRLVITAFLGVSANAVYAVANKVPSLLSLAQGVMVMAWQENASIAVKGKNANEYFTKMFDSIFRLMIGVTALLIAFTPAIFKILIRGDYDEAYYQMPLLILGMFFFCMSSFQGGIYIAHLRTKSVGVSTMIAATINILIDIIFVNVIGITAGSLSTLIAFFALYVYRIFDSKKFQPMHYNVKLQILLLGIIIAMLIICFIRNLYLNVVNLVIGIVFFVALNKEVIKKMLKTIMVKI